MLEEKLQHLLTELRAEEMTPKSRYDLVKTWFGNHAENLAETEEELVFLCELPYAERSVLTYPVMGNWVVDKMNGYQPQTEHQRNIFGMMKSFILENRFNNPHMEKYYDTPLTHTKMEDELTVAMLSNPEESMTLRRFLREISRGLGDLIYKRELPTSKPLETDLGHGLSAPVKHLTYYSSSTFENLVEDYKTGPVGLTIMVVDDESPEEWYRRLLAVGFEEKAGQPGMFYDCETALAALEKSDYDVILTDIDLGQGKMDGLTFVEKAYDIQTRKGIRPMISVFSYSDERLEEAESRFPHNSEIEKLSPEIDRYFNNKRVFTAAHFKHDVVFTLHLQEYIEKNRKSLGWV
jgi:CheY-like chemotaxis protein